MSYLRHRRMHFRLLSFDISAQREGDRACPSMIPTGQFTNDPMIDELVTKLRQTPDRADQRAITKKVVDR